MEILAFRIRGKLAHFRKYYANNTAMSFTVPPRTSIMGIMAAFMGLAKDSYYEAFSSENIRIGIRVLTPLKKTFHRLNLLSIKSLGDVSRHWSSDFRGAGGRIQTPFEVVCPWQIGKEDLAYQVFVAPNTPDARIFNTIKDHFLHKPAIFCPTLGTANFTAAIDAIQLVPGENIRESTSTDFILFDSAIPVRMVQELAFDSDAPETSSFIEEDLMPGDFSANGNREVRAMNRILFSTTRKPLKVKLLGPYYNVQFQEESVNIQFVDS